MRWKHEENKNNDWVIWGRRKRRRLGTRSQGLVDAIKFFFFNSIKISRESVWWIWKILFFQKQICEDRNETESLAKMWGKLKEKKREKKRYITEGKKLFK